MIAAKDIPEIAKDKSPYVIDNVAPPNPKTNIVAATTTFLVFVKNRNTTKNRGWNCS